ncbi:RNA methyltransferase [bacterium]|nr:RNA methyltransferase [bacterium]
MNIFFVTCAKGLEQVLAEELKSLGITNLRIDVGGISFKGTFEDCYKANLWLRTANRILLIVDKFFAYDDTELYEKIRKINWQKHITNDSFFCVDVNLKDSKMTHSQFVARRIKDAIVDQFREKTGNRPSIDTFSPDLRINVRIFRDEVTLSFDSSGDSLHKRGYRTETGKASLKETLAAGLVLLSNWDKKTDFYDFTCGSGTILIEAAHIALNVAPGIFRQKFGFETWNDFDPKIWQKLKDEAKKLKKSSLPYKFYGSDVNSKNLSNAHVNAKNAKVLEFVELTRKDAREFTPKKNEGVIVSNLPYGERTYEVDELKETYKKIGDTLKQNCKGLSAYLLTEQGILTKSIGLKVTKRHVLFNGDLECRLLEILLY